MGLGFKPSVSTIPIHTGSQVVQVGVEPTNNSRRFELRRFTVCTLYQFNCQRSLSFPPFVSTDANIACRQQCTFPRGNGHRRCSSTSRLSAFFPFSSSSRQRESGSSVSSTCSCDPKTKKARQPLVAGLFSPNAKSIAVASFPCKGIRRQQ